MRHRYRAHNNANITLTWSCWKCVEFWGEGIKHLTLEDRATIANMSPEYGATCGLFFPDEETLRYLRDTGRPQEHVSRVHAYFNAQGLLGQHAHTHL